jgi:hypothetical protein
MEIQARNRRLHAQVVDMMHGTVRRVSSRVSIQSSSALLYSHLQIGSLPFPIPWFQGTNNYAVPHFLRMMLIVAVNLSVAVAVAVLAGQSLLIRRAFDTRRDPWAVARQSADQA